MRHRHVLTTRLFSGKQYLRFSGVFIALFLCFGHPTSADEIHLRNGDRISGQFVDLSPLYCIFTTSHQATLYIERQEILQLHTTQSVVVELASSERIVGTIESSDEIGIILLQSERFGALPVKLTDIMRITRVENAFVTNPEPQPVEKAPLPPRPLDSSSTQRRSVSPTLTTVKNNTATPSPKQPLQKTTYVNQTVQEPNEKITAPTLSREEEEENNIRQTVLRQSTVLLKTGEKEIATGVSYSRDTTTAARRRVFELPFIIRSGLTDRLESSLHIPIVWSEYTTFAGDYRDYAFGVGDMALNFNYLVSREIAHWPDVYGSVGVGMPTSNEYAPLEADKATTGTGHWNLFSGVTLAKSFDPAILFGGLGYTHIFKRKFSGIEVAPGDSWDYFFGLGLSINPELALGFQFLGTYQKATKYAGQVANLSYEPMYLELSLPYDVTSDTFIEPSLTFGLNDEATDVILDFYYSHKF